MDAELTICITHFQKLDRLRTTVERIYEHTPSTFRLKLFNNGYLDAAVESYLSDLEERDEVTVIYHDENIGIPGSRYELLQDIETPFVMVLDDDMYVCEGWYETVMDIFEANPDVGFVGVPFHSPGSDRLAGSREFRIEDGVIHTRLKDFTDLETADSPFVEVEEVTDGAYVMRAECLDVFEYDPYYFIGFGDLDRVLQIRQSPWKQVMTTEISFVHDNLQRDAAYKAVRRNYNEIRRSYLHFVEKWGLRYPLMAHIRFKYVFAVPNSVLQTVSRIRGVLGV